MDFTTLNTKIGAEAGAFLHLEHPATGLPLYDDTGTAIGVMVRGTESKTVQDRLKGLQKAQVKGATAEDTGLDFVSSLIISFVGVEKAGRPLQPVDADLKFFFGLSDSFVEQVIEFAKDRSNFFGQTSPSASLPLGKSAS